MQAIPTNKRNNLRVIVALIAATAIVGFSLVAKDLSVVVDTPSGSPAQTEAAVFSAGPLVHNLANGPIAGMPEGTYQALTAAGTGFPGLADGPVDGMPEGTYQSLTEGLDVFAPSLANEPVSGMPEGTFEAITAGQASSRPAGIPDYVWKELSR